MASGLFIIVLLSLVGVSIGVSIREAPLQKLLTHKLDAVVIFLSILLLFDVVCVAILIRFGTVLS